ncbi:hypothetical protein [Sorangium sp. So ce693]|uniref:hypothetical protein n=1 Tax=Sorangium sp. So ce693 TaxID=3133318 RepID=UPI003F617C50
MVFLADAPATYWPMLIANGVTGVREMGGSSQRIDRARRLNDASAAGRVDAPEIVLIPGNIISSTVSPREAIQTAQKQVTVIFNARWPRR